MDEIEAIHEQIQNDLQRITGLDPAALSGDGSQGSWSTTYTIPADAELTFDKPRENPPEDPLQDLMTASLASHYIIDRISRDELVNRLLKIWPNAGGLDLSEFMDKLDIDKDTYWRKVRGEEQVGK